MLWSRFILILLFTLVSSRPGPELSLEEIEKELEQLTAKENDSSDTTKKTTDQADTAAKQTAQSDVPKEIADKLKTKDVPEEKLEALDKSVTETAEQKKDETTKTEAATDKKTADASKFPAEPVKSALPELPRRDATESGMRSESDLPSHALPKFSFRDTAAYRRLLAEARDPRFPQLPKPRDNYKLYDYPPLPQHFPPAEAPARRQYNGFFRSKSHDNPPSSDSSWNRRGFLPNSDPIEMLRARGIPLNDMTRTERMALRGGTWLPDSDPVKVPARIPLPAHPDTAGRSYNDVHEQLNDKETEDLIHGKSGLTDAEKRKRFLMELLAEKLKSKVNEAQKRGLKIPTKIMDFLWDYESRRGMDTLPDKNRLSH